MSIGNVPEKPWGEIKKNKPPKNPNQVEDPLQDDEESGDDEFEIYNNPSAPREPNHDQNRNSPLSV